MADIFDDGFVICGCQSAIYIKKPDGQRIKTPLSCLHAAMFSLKHWFVYKDSSAKRGL